MSMWVFMTDEYLLSLSEEEMEINVSMGKIATM